MAFVVQNWSEIGRSMNTGGPAVFSYISTTDNLATISAANYFSNRAPILNVGDFIMVRATDNANIYSVITSDDTVIPYTVTVTADVITVNPELDQVITGIITTEEMLTLATTGTPLIVNSGAPYNGIIVVNATFEYIYNTTAFTIDDPTNQLTLAYSVSGTPTGAIASMGIPLTGFVDQTHDVMAFSQGFLSSVVSSVDMADCDVVVFIDGGVNLADGDGAIRYTIEYRTIPVGGTL